MWAGQSAKLRVLYVIVKPTTSRISVITRGRGVNNKDILRVQVRFNWLYPRMIFVVLVYNSGNHNVLINDWYTCQHVLSKQLYVWNAYLSLLDYTLVIAGL